MTRIVSGICLILAATGCMLLADNYLDACAMVRSRAYTSPIEIAQESAIIIWDEASKTEHFIRRSSYKTEARDFGFLVPTPTRPELAEAKDAAFKQLEDLTAAPIIYPPGQARDPNTGGAAPKVEVLEIKRVAGFDAAVLKTDDAKALNEWLKTNNYQSSPELAAWLEPYVKSGWIITAFKIASDTPKTKAINTSAVRMSFKTDRPFYPYREPASQRPVAEPGKEPDNHRVDAEDVLGIYIEGIMGERGFQPPAVGFPHVVNEDGTLPLPLIAPLKVKGMTISEVRKAVIKAYTIDNKMIRVGKEPGTAQGQVIVSLIRPHTPKRLLRVYVLAKERMQANLGDKDWPGKTVCAFTVHVDRCKELAKHLQMRDWQPAGTMWLTELEDRSSPRPGTDELYFAASKDQSGVTRPPVFGGGCPFPHSELPRVEPDVKKEPANPR